ncbi:EamA family transporter [Roseibium suaedae]|uniref:Transporter family protein n=1 Tax=Roseibium suaedae TaxID=735517 RepID=A0A1M7IGY6_9HYPH|nr:EamA family transporter [Roseibium suaedae]SHM40044.1 transporter family protein [Roseibium suaedae]
MRDTWQLWAVLAAIFAAATALLGKLGVNEIGSNLATFIRTIVILGLTGAIAVAAGEMKGVSELSAKGTMFLVLSGLATGASWLCYYRALKMGTASQVAPVDKLSVVFVAILGTLFLGESLSLKAWAGVVLIAGGALLVAQG